MTMMKIYQIYLVNAPATAAQRQKKKNANINELLSFNRLEIRNVLPQFHIWGIYFSHSTWIKSSILIFFIFCWILFRCGDSQRVQHSSRLRRSFSSIEEIKWTKPKSCVVHCTKFYCSVCGGMMVMVLVGKCASCELLSWTKRNNIVHFVIDDIVVWRIFRLFFSLFFPFSNLNCLSAFIGFNQM